MDVPCTHECAELHLWTSATWLGCRYWFMLPGETRTPVEHKTRNESVRKDKNCWWALNAKSFEVCLAFESPLSLSIAPRSIYWQPLMLPNGQIEIPEVLLTVWFCVDFYLNFSAVCFLCPMWNNSCNSAINSVCKIKLTREVGHVCTFIHHTLHEA